MKHLLIATIAAVLVVGCGEAQQSAPAPEAQPAEPVAEASQPKPPTVKAPDISIYNAVDRGNIEAVKQHIAAGTDVNARDDRTGWTPLHWAVRFGRKEVAELLIAKGADVNAKQAVEGETPLHLATWDGYKEIAELLINNGADVNAKDEDGRTPLDWAKEITNRHTLEDKASKKETVDLLRKHGGKKGDELKAEGKEALKAKETMMLLTFQFPINLPKSNRNP
jgi:ankyrin repeat protein